MDVILIVMSTGIFWAMIPKLITYCKIYICQFERSTQPGDDAVGTVEVITLPRRPQGPHMDLALAKLWPVCQFDDFYSFFSRWNCSCFSFFLFVCWFDSLIGDLTLYPCIRFVPWVELRWRKIRWNWTSCREWTRSPTLCSAGPTLPSQLWDKKGKGEQGWERIGKEKHGRESRGKVEQGKERRKKGEQGKERRG